MQISGFGITSDRRGVTVEVIALQAYSDSWVAVNVSLTDV